MNLLSTKAARAVAKACPYDNCPCHDNENDIIGVAAPLIATEYEPVMNVLREALGKSQKVAYRYRFEGNYVECLFCLAHSTQHAHWSYVTHTPDCWVSRARKIVGEA